MTAQRLYVAHDIVRDIVGDILTERWEIQTGGVPRGLLCFLVTDMIAKKPMSGVEIVEVITKETGGRWIPSSGSIYPLLAWMQKKGYTNELPSEQIALKRYALTSKGKEFFEKQFVIGRKLLDKLEFIVPLLIGKFQFNPNDEKILAGTKAPAQKIVKTLLDLRADNLKLTDAVSMEVEQILKKCADDLEEIVQRQHEKASESNRSKKS